MLESSKPTRAHRDEQDTATEQEGRQVPRAALLDAWADFDWSQGCELDRLPALQGLSIRTTNTVYELLVVSPHTGDILIRGGSFFPTRCRARLAGSSLGGSFLKLRSIHPGFCMELHAEGYTIVTSPVEAVEARDLEAGPPQ